MYLLKEKKPNYWAFPGKFDKSNGFICTTTFLINVKSGFRQDNSWLIFCLNEKKGLVVEENGSQ